ncbi:MAG: MBL fold metallo-hydrolase [Gemmatimonadota bacterium]|nr:MAG: MBL fold metallo-hydrolase [Gemmatimonadota bacterium]
MNARNASRPPDPGRAKLLGAAVAVLPFMALVVLGESTGPGAAQESDGNWLLELFDHRGADIGAGIPMWGYSAFVRYDGHTILFDGGTSAAVLEHNARTYGVDLREVDFAVLSHAHGDHTAGLDYLLEVNPSVHLYIPQDGHLGYATQEGREYRPGYRYATDNMEFVAGNREVEEGVHLIFTRSPHIGYFTRYPPNEAEAQLIGLPEVSLALETQTGELVLISGCSHSGIEEIVKAAKQATGAEVALVTGGFHLVPYSADYIAQLANMMKDELNVRRVAPTHCTGDVGVAIFEKVYGDYCVKAGLGTRIAFSP